MSTLLTTLQGAPSFSPTMGLPEHINFAWKPRCRARLKGDYLSNLVWSFGSGVATTAAQDAYPDIAAGA